VRLLYLVIFARASVDDQRQRLALNGMQVLGMPGSVFKVDLPKKENGVHYNGDESVDFLVRTNMGSDFKALKKACWWYCCAKVSFCCCRPSNEALAPLRACRDCAMLS
jgi:hypothetical protein